MRNEICNSDKEIDLSIPLWKANIYSFPIFILTLIFTISPYAYFWGTEKVYSEFSSTFNFLLLFSIFVVGIVLHEFIHAISWGTVAKIPFSKIKFGFNLKSLSPYAHCGEAVTAKVYRIALLTPAIILGIIPILISFITGSVWCFVTGLLFTVTACGDFLIFWLIRKVKNDQLVADHPERAGCCIVFKSNR